MRLLRGYILIVIAGEGFAPIELNPGILSVRENTLYSDTLTLRSTSRERVTNVHTKKLTRFRAFSSHLDQVQFRSKFKITYSFWSLERLRKGTIKSLMLVTVFHRGIKMPQISQDSNEYIIECCLLHLWKSKAMGLFLSRFEI